MPLDHQTPPHAKNPHDTQRVALLRARRDDPEGHLQIHVRDVRLDADAPLIRIGRGEGERYREDVRAGHLVCPDPACDQPLMILRAGSRRDHVAHRRQPTCGTHSPEGMLHEQGKRLLAQVLRRSHPERAVRLEVTLPDRSRRADVHMDGPEPVAIEVQGAPLSADGLHARRADYARAGVRDYWVFIVESAHVRPARVRGHHDTAFEDSTALWALSDTAAGMLHDDGGLLFIDPDAEQLGYLLCGTPEATPQVDGVIHGADQPAVAICWAPVTEVTRDKDGRFMHPVFDAHRARRREAEQERRRAEEERRRAAQAQREARERHHTHKRWLRERAMGEQILAHGETELFAELICERLDAEAEREQRRIAPATWALATYALEFPDPAGARSVFDSPAERVNTWALAMDRTLFAVRVIECLDDLSRGGRRDVPTGQAIGAVSRRCYPSRCPEAGKLRRQLDLRFARRVERREVAAAIYSVLRRLRGLGLLDYDTSAHGGVGDLLHCVALTEAYSAPSPAPVAATQSL